MPKKYGLQFDTIKHDDYYLGGGFIGTQEIQPDGQWDAFLPTEELQNRNEVETMACTVFGTLNCIETLINHVFHETRNFSERFTAIMAGVTPAGGSPHTAAESIRSVGLINEESLPVTSEIDSWDKYYHPKPMDASLLHQARAFQIEFDFKHEWVFVASDNKTQRIAKIKEALKRSPVGLSVFAWSEGPNNIYQKLGGSNHWVCCYGYTDNAWKIFDSYDNTHKLYSMASDIEMAKLYWIAKQPKKLSLLDRIKLKLCWNF